MALAEVERLLEDRLLDRRQQPGDRRFQAVPRGRGLALAPGDVAPGEHHLPVRHVARPDLDAQRDAAHLPIVELPPGGEPLADVQLDTDRVFQPGVKVTRRLQHRRALLVLAPDRHDDHLDRREARRQHEALVIAVRHHDRADHARAQSPGCRPHELLRVVLVEEFDVERAREVLPQEVAGAGLQRLAILHHRLDRVAGDGPGELLALALATGEHGDRGLVHRKIRVDAEHPQRLFHRLVARRVRGVAFLPEELRRAQEQARPHLPAHHVGPLVDEQRQVAVRLNPLGIHVPDDRLRRGAHDQPLLQFGASANGDDRQLRREALHVLGLLLQEALRDEEREVGVDVPGRLEAAVQRIADVLPERVAVGLDDHTAAHRRIVGQIGLLHDLVIPLGKVLALRSQKVCHDAPSENSLVVLSRIVISLK